MEKKITVVIIIMAVMVLISADFNIYQAADIYRMTWMVKPEIPLNSHNPLHD
ncbi:MAG: hypothetical protein WCJ54_02350 [Actinomycetota bacterium]